MMLAQYFALQDTPMAESPVGKMMQRIIAEYPLELTTRAQFDGIRRQAIDSLSNASGKKTYAPMTPSQSQKARLAAQKRFRKR